MGDIQQSVPYRRYIKSLGWNISTIESAVIFHKKFPIIGGLAKIQRIRTMPDRKKLARFLKSQNIRAVAIEPSDSVTKSQLSGTAEYLRLHGFRINTSPYLPTKTLMIPTVLREEELFMQLSEAKRRGVRRARKCGVTVRETDSIESLIAVKQKSAGIFGFITTHGLKELWKAFFPGHATILLAYAEGGTPIGGVLMLFLNRTAFYWIAGAGKTGKKMFAPTLLVWEALKISHLRGMKEFDFVGVWDERLPAQNREWKGFTRFKEGFGGSPRYYPYVV